MQICTLKEGTKGDHIRILRHNFDQQRQNMFK